ncbi:protein phosphatase 2C domain-containing protein [Fredinandcohnia humi]
MYEFTWVGSQESFVDIPSIQELGSIVIGRHGGNSSSGQTKNEDGCLVWQNKFEDWEFITLLDAHHTSESADLILTTFTSKKRELQSVLSQPIGTCFARIEETILGIFKSKEFLAACKQITGETACLIVFRKDKYLWWFSVGDNLLYLFHPELIALGQYQINQRHFYEWIGQVNTFNQPVPCFSSGRKELRKGNNHLIVTTDGLVECPSEPYINPEEISKVFINQTNVEGVTSLLENIRIRNVRDSTTIISWFVKTTKEATLPSNK